MPELSLDDVTIAYETFGPATGDPVVLVCGLGQPAGSWQLGMVPALTEAGFRVVTFDNRGMEPSSSPPAPYTIDQMVGDTIGLIDHIGLHKVGVVGYSMGGWVAETLAYRHPDRVHAAVFIGSCNSGTSWEKVITTVERDMARIDPELPHWFNAVETMRYLPNHELQQDGIVDDWIALIGDLPPWPNPGRLGQYEAALAWSLDLERTKRWPSISIPCMVLSFEHDIDSPPAHAREAASNIPGSEFVDDRRSEPSRGIHPREAGRRRGCPLLRTGPYVTGEQTARVDQWLWSVRIYRTRSAATEACRGGHVKVNRSAAKPATPVRAGDMVSVRFPGRERLLEVVQVIRGRVGAPLAVQCLVDHSPPAPPKSAQSPLFERDQGSGRPTKQDRRAARPAQARLNENRRLLSELLPEPVEDELGSRYPVTGCPRTRKLVALSGKAHEKRIAA